MATVFPAQFKQSNFILMADIKAAPGKGAEFMELLKTVRDDVKLNEPGNLCYRISRGVGEQSDDINVYEEYTGEEAVNA